MLRFCHNLNQNEINYFKFHQKLTAKIFCCFSLFFFLSYSLTSLLPIFVDFVQQVGYSAPSALNILLKWWEREPCSRTRTCISKGVSELHISLTSQGPGKHPEYCTSQWSFLSASFTRHLSYFFINSAQEKMKNSYIIFLSFVLINKKEVLKSFNSAMSLIWVFSMCQPVYKWEYKDKDVGFSSNLQSNSGHHYINKYIVVKHAVTIKVHRK